MLIYSIFILVLGPRVIQLLSKMSYIRRQEAIAAFEAMKAEIPLPVFAWSSELQLQEISLDVLNIGNQIIPLKVSKQVNFFLHYFVCIFVL